MTEKLDDLATRFNYLKDYYSPMYSEMMKADEYYQGDFEMTAPKQSTKYRLPTARNNIELAALEMITDTPIVKRRRDAHPESWRGDDDKVELAIQNFLLNLEYYLQTPVFHEAAKLLLKRGEAVLAGPFFNESDKVVWVEPYDPLTVLLEPGMSPHEGFVHLEMTVAEMEQIARQVKKLSKFNRKDRKLTEIITLIQWWSYNGEDLERLHKVGQYAAWVDKDMGFLAEPQPSGYPYLPLEPVWSGWGQATIGALPSHRAVSLLHRQYRDALRSESEIFTMMQDQSSKGVWGHYYLEQGQALPEDFVLLMEPGSITEGVPAGGLHTFPNIGLPDYVKEQWAVLQGVLHESGIQPILSGTRQPGVTTATAYQMLSGASRKKFYPPVRMLQGGITRVTRKLCLLAEMLGEAYPEAFTWRGAKLDTKLLHDDYDVVVELLAEDKEERRMLMAQGLTMKDELPERTRLEKFYGEENVHQAQIDKMVDKILSSDVVLNEIARRIGIVAREGEEKKTTVPATTAIQPMEQIAAIMRAGRQGFVPAQPGTVEGQGQLVSALRGGMPPGA